MLSDSPTLFIRTSLLNGETKEESFELGNVSDRRNKMVTRSFAYVRKVNFCLGRT